MRKGRGLCNHTIIPHILREPNSIIVLLFKTTYIIFFTGNMKKFKYSLLPRIDISRVGGYEKETSN